MIHNNCINTMSGTSLSTAETLSLTWSNWLRDGKSLFAAEVLRMATANKRWIHRAQTRRKLKALDPRLLNDVGITRAQALEEARKPFWQE